MSPAQPARRAADKIAPTAVEAVFEAILADIVRGTYGAGAHLPAERELARRLGASRPTLREALRRLAEWNLVEARRGSGVVVRDKRDWSIEVLPAYLRHAPRSDGLRLPGLVRDLLALRRAMMVEIVRLVADRIPRGGTAGPRAAIARAWAVRADGRAFAAEDFAAMRALVEAAGFLPAVWMLNRLSGVYLDIARSISGAIPPPDDYVAAHDKFLGAIDKQDGEAAVAALARYLERHDKRLLSALEAFQ